MAFLGKQLKRYQVIPIKHSLEEAQQAPITVAEEAAQAAGAPTSPAKDMSALQYLKHVLHL